MMMMMMRMITAMSLKQIMSRAPNGDENRNNYVRRLKFLTHRGAGG